MCKISDKENRKYRCQTCDKAYTSAYHLKEHKQIAHSDEYNYHCSMCTEKLKTNTHLKLHMKKCHSEKGLFICPTCKKNFNIEYYFLNHKRKCERRHEQGAQRYECNLCFKTYTSSVGLNSHKTAFHKGLRNYVQLFKM